METPGPPEPPVGPVRARYFLGVGITVFVVLSQYFVPQEWPAARVLYGNLPGDLFVVYGIPIVAFLLLVGVGPLTRWRANLATAAWEGVGWYGLLSLLALGVLLGLAIVYEIVDPSVLSLLNRPNPALTQATGNPWFFVGFSFAVGALEETIFRGWIFGFWQHRRDGWLAPALWTSAVFAGVHLYYGTTYGLASPLIFPTLFLTGFAFAATYHYSGGNLVVIALLHGQMDAVAFLTLVSPGAALAIHYVGILVATIVAVIAYARSGPAVPDLGPVGPILRYLGASGAPGSGEPPRVPG